MSRPLTSYVFAVLTSDDGHIKIHVQLGHDEDPLVSEEQ